MYRKNLLVILLFILFINGGIAHANGGIKTRVTAVIDHYASIVVNRNGCDEVQFHLTRYDNVIQRGDTFGHPLDPCTTEIRLLMYNHVKYVAIQSGNDRLILVRTNDQVVGYSNRFLMFNGRIVFNRGNPTNEQWIPVTNYLYGEIPNG